MAHQLKPIPFDIGAPSLGADVEGTRRPSSQQLETQAAPLIAAAIAHELRATLALISGYSQTVQHLPLDNDVRVRYLERISSASMSLSELADEMLAVAASPHRGSEPIVQPLSLRQVYSRLTAQLRVAADLAALHVEVPADLPLVDADPMWITLVVRNLVTNAVKYASGSPICLSAWQNGEWVVTRLSDEGSGVPARERRRLFEPMFRGRQARESGSPGSGQGLYLCKLLIEAHGGRIWIDDTADGFAVAFSLPRARRPFLVAHDDVARELMAVGPGLSTQRGA